MFFAKFAASLALVAPLVSGLTITTPTNWTSGGQAVIDWTAVNGDPQTFSVELVNPSFNRQFALANNVETGALTLSLELPVVPVGDGYNLQFVGVGNITDVFSETGDFAIGATVSSSASSTSSSAVSGSAGSSASLTLSNSNSNSASASASSGFGTTVSATTATGASTGSNSQSSSASVASSSSFNSGAVALGVSHANLAGFAVMAAAALAGARLVGF